MGVSPTRVSGIRLRSLRTIAADFASGASMAQADSNPSTFGFAPVKTLFLPDLSLPNQARMSSARASAVAPVGLSARRALSVFVESLSAAQPGWARVVAMRSESPRVVRVLRLMACPSCGWLG